MGEREQKNRLSMGDMIGLAIIIFIFLGVGKVMSVCTPGARMSTPDIRQWKAGPWGGGGANAWVPNSIVPLGTGRPTCNYMAVGLSAWSCGRPNPLCNNGEADGQWGQVAGAYRNLICWSNPGLQCIAYDYTCSSGAANSYDYNCNGYTDDADPPVNLGDNDGDGVLNQYDSKPDNSDCPNSGWWILKFYQVNKTTGCKIYNLEDSNPSSNCGWQTLSQCGAVNTYDNNWFTYIVVSSGALNWNEISGATNATNSTQGSYNTNTASWWTTEPGNTTGGGSNTANYAAVNSTDLKILADYMWGIQQNTGRMNTQLTDLQNYSWLQVQNGNLWGEQIVKGLAEVKEAVGNQGGAGNINVNMGGVETRLDTSNQNLTNLETKIDQGNAALNAITDKIPAMGEGELPEGDTTAINDDTTYNEAAANVYSDSAKGALGSFLDSFIQNNPIAAWISGTGVQYSGGSSSVSFNIQGMGSYSLSATWLGQAIDDNGIGTFFMALATFAGIVAVLRD